MYLHILRKTKYIYVWITYIAIRGGDLVFCANHFTVEAHKWLRRDRNAINKNNYTELLRLAGEHND